MRSATAILVLLSVLTVLLAPSLMRLNYELHVEEITEKYCINKEQPELQCNGQCHLAQQLKQVAPEQSPQSPPDVRPVSFSFFEDPLAFIPLSMPAMNQNWETPPADRLQDGHPYPLPLPPWRVAFA